MKHYLYGLTIHSIQSYIFQTNKLKEIAGASELVEHTCTTMFAKILGKEIEELKADPNAIRNAAGNIRYIFTNEIECRKVVKNFPKLILETAPGVLISQAVVKADGRPTDQHFYELEKRLTAQRNNPIRPVDLGYMAVNTSRRTGLPSVCKVPDGDNDLPIDRVTLLKQKQKPTKLNQAFFKEYFIEDRLTTEVEEITKSNGDNYNWLAVIHADGNNMGQALQNLNKETIAQQDYGKASKKFSEVIDKSTKAAAHSAFMASIPKQELDGAGTIPFRPIIVGGDDLTVVCRADLALKFTQYYLEEFEKQTKQNFTEVGFISLKNGLTACAGIAYIKVNYPFHYAVDLAEALCSQAKKVAKSKPGQNALTPSCLMFHKVQDSFVENYTEIIERELTAKPSGCTFDFGPYFLKMEPKIDDLLKNVSQFKGKEGNAIKSGLRQWLTDLHDNKEIADQWMMRIISVGNEGILNNLNLPTTHGYVGSKSPVYDWLTILSINQNNTNDENN